jgi:[protein-PII] uridylyltransferase
MDRFIRSLFLDAAFSDKAEEIHEGSVALAALGSYGRRELCLGSDVDLLVIHQGRLSRETSEMIRRVLYTLWDVKLEVGHSVLTFQECNRLALSDFRFLTSVMDARFLLGARSFYRLFEAAFWSKIDREKETIRRQFLLYQQKRREKYGTQEYFLEPDIKEGMGGLRDIHFMAWAAKLYFRSKRLRDVKRFSVFSHFGLDKLHESESFLLKVRNQLHLLAGGRREDRLLLPHQPRVARSLGFKNGAFNTGPEKFMRDLHGHLNRIRYRSEEFHVKAMELIDPQPEEPPPEEISSDFQAVKGKLVLKGGDLSPLLVLKALAEANRRGMPLGSGLIWEASKKIEEHGKTLLRIPEAKSLFLELIYRPSDPRILRLALELGLITLFIPEFKKIRNLAQFTYYHSETVDLHSLKTLETLHDVARGVYGDRWPMFKQVYDDLKNPEWLFLVGLLHDVGKGYRGEHSARGAEIVARVLKRLGLDEEAGRVIPFLIQHHLLLANISQRRDLNDEKTAVQVAQIVGDLETLRLLLLLTVADSLATGPMASSDWKIMLLIELFFKVRRILQSGTLASPDATRTVEEHKAALSRSLVGAFSGTEITELMDQVSTRYFVNVSLEDMVEHFRMALGMEDQKLFWTLKKVRHAPVTHVILCSRDRPGLFSKMVGVFTLHNISVLSGNIYTLKNGLAFDLYDVTNPLDPLREEEMWSKVLEDARQAIEDKLPLDELISRKAQTVSFEESLLPYHPAERVRVDNEGSDFFTILEVGGGTRMGLLYDLAKRIFALGLDIRFAKVNSDKEKMTGVFYVRDASGQKIYENSLIEKVRREILGVLQ